MLRSGSGTPTPGLRRRVGLTVFALVAVVMVALGVTINLVLSANLHDDLRNRLLDRAAFAQFVVRTSPGISAQDLADAVKTMGDDVDVQLFPTDGQRPVIGEQHPEFGVGHGGPRPRPGAAAPPQVTGARVSTQLDRLVVSIQVPAGRLEASASQHGIDATLQRLVLLELSGGGAALALLAVLLSATLRLTMRPLGRMTALATSIAGGARGQRLRPRNPNSELGRTATAFDAMLDELETAVADARAAEIRMRAFLSDASHELRTPVAGVSASAELLLTADLDRASRERLAAGLVGQSRRIGRLVDDLLLSARLAEPGVALDAVEVDVAAVVAAQVEQARLFLTDVDVDLRVDAGPHLVAGDPTRLAQIVTNLLDNARHATPPGGRICVSVTAAGGAVDVVVDDSGLGVPDALREHIFGRFVRLDRSRSGSGLGLSISRAVAAAHSGTLQCAGRSPDGGARFVLRMPASGSPARVGQSWSSNSPSASVSRRFAE